MNAPSLKYLQVSEYLRQQIQSGVWRVGDRLPSHSELRAQFVCTQVTIERAHALLEKDGLIKRLHRQGTFVAASEPVKKPGAFPTDEHDWLSNTVAVASFYGHDGHLAARTGWESSIIHGALSTLQQRDMHALLVHPSSLLPAKSDHFARHAPMGIVLSLSSFAPQQIADVLAGLRHSHTPVVVYGNVLQFAHYDSVVSDHVAGARKLTRYLVSRGCQRIANIQFDDSHVLAYWQVERERGYDEAMRESGLKPLETCRVSKHEADEHGTEEAQFFAGVTHLLPYLRALFQTVGECDALLVESDGLVPEVAATCRLLGVEPGRDILLAGYDNYWQWTGGTVFEPTKPVATIDKHNFQLGAATVQLLAERIRGVLPVAPQRRSIEPELIVAESSKTQSRIGALQQSDQLLLHHHPK